MKAFRLLVDPPGAGDWNMAVDEVLWQGSAATGRCCWRFYRWEEATLSLGYFQSYDDRAHHAASLSCPVVRRASGGGAIVHDQELTYSLAIPATHPLARRRSPLYRAVHTTLIEALAELGIVASLHAEPEDPRPAEQPFLCFQRRAPGDVMVGGTKIAGSAQRRSRGAVLQHGSVLLRRSHAAPELEGLDSFAPAPVREERLIEVWLENLSRRLGMSWAQDPLHDQERQEAQRLVQAKYGSSAWTEGRGRVGNSPLL